MDFTIHTPETAPADTKASLEDSLAKYKFIPNLHAVMAESPALLDAYKLMTEIYAKTTLSVLERQIVLLAINYENDCHYCMAAHSAIATMEKMPADILAALRDGTPLADPKLETLRRFAAKMTSGRGWVDEAEKQAMLDAGYSRRTMQEVLVGVAYKVMSNYQNHLAETPVDAGFQTFAWAKNKATAA
ncbi:MAG: carboxymuconolactone decarboxylase family protein [Pseudomonadota bacterium]